MTIERKIWKGDLLRLQAGRSFYGMDVVEHRAGFCMVWQDCEEGDPLVEIGGSLIVKRADLCELNAEEVTSARAMGTLIFAGLNHYSREEVDEAKRILAPLLHRVEP